MLLVAKGRDPRRPKERRNRQPLLSNNEGPLSSIGERKMGGGGRDEGGRWERRGRRGTFT